MSKTNAIDDLSRRLKSFPEQRKEFKELVKLALITRIAVANLLSQVIGEEDESRRDNIREEIEGIEEEFSNKKGEFTKKLAEKEISFEEFNYNDLCNTLS